MRCLKYPGHTTFVIWPTAPRWPHQLFLHLALCMPLNAPPHTRHDTWYFTRHNNNQTPCVCSARSTFSRLNHSCRANAVYHHSSLGARIFVRLLRSVAPSEQISVCYTDPLMPHSARRLDLALKYAFSCQCVRCQQQQEQEQEEQKPQAGQQAGAGKDGDIAMSDVVHCQAPVEQCTSVAAGGVELRRPTDWFLDHVAVQQVGSTGGTCDEAGSTVAVAGSTGGRQQGGMMAAAAEGPNQWQQELGRMVGVAEQLLDEGQYEECYTVTHATLMRVIRKGGVHPWHHSCLQAAVLLSTAASACAVKAAQEQRRRRVHDHGHINGGETSGVGQKEPQGEELGSGSVASSNSCDERQKQAQGKNQPAGGVGAVMQWHARVLCAQLLQCGAVEGLLSAGETAVVPHAARVCADLAASACSALAAATALQPQFCAQLDLSSQARTPATSRSSCSSSKATALEAPAGWVQVQRELWAVCCGASGWCSFWVT